MKTKKALLLIQSMLKDYSTDAKKWSESDIPVEWFEHLNAKDLHELNGLCNEFNTSGKKHYEKNLIDTNFVIVDTMVYWIGKYIKSIQT